MKKIISFSTKYGWISAIEEKGKITEINFSKKKNSGKSLILNKLKKNIPDKLLMVAEAFRKNISIQKIYLKSKIDKWFLEQIKEIVDVERQIIKKGLPKNVNKKWLTNKGYQKRVIKKGLTKKVNKKGLTKKG